ncbi:MAG: MFS transporter [Acidobacteria bacterium]|nr:MAG: MFS transporter [Acidobacteriota bacterium]PYY21155.1 MAG: MFS transporter [Acidobacteriota bacterium]
MANPFAFIAEATPAQRRTLLAAALGWMLDAFDVMLYSLVVAYIIRDLHMSKQTAGLLNTLTLLASGIGGVLFGFIADRIGRTRALMLSILTYSVCSFASGLATSVVVLACVRFLLGLGMGGEWNTGATLVAESWPTQFRARALAVVQSSWAIGYALAAVVAGVMLQRTTWRFVFFVGVLPALVTLWIQQGVPESELWKERRTGAPPTTASEQVRFVDLFGKRYRRKTVTLLLMNMFGMFGWWGLFTWIPPYLSLPVEQGGRGFSALNTTGLLVFLNLIGMAPGYSTFGWVADRLGRRPSVILYTVMAAAFVPLYAAAREPAVLLVLGAIVAFFGTGFFSGSGIIGSELFPTDVRARALGFTYNGARAMSSVAPFTIGRIGQQHGLNSAFYVCAVAFLLSALIAIFIPETLGTELT